MSLIFFDEADSVLGKRLTTVTQAHDHEVNMSRSVLLTELERHDGVVVFATNLAGNIDSAFRRRLLGYARFDLPNEACRKRIWEKYMPSQLPLAADVDTKSLASAFDGVSGGEIRNAVLHAAALALLRIGAGSDTPRISQDDLRCGMAEVLKLRNEIPDSHANSPGTTSFEVVMK